MAPSNVSLGRGFGPVNSHVLVTGAGFACRTPPGGEAADPKNADPVVERESEHAADPDFLARFLDAPAVKANMPRLDQRLGEGPALHHANEEEEAIDPHLRRSFSSSAKAWLGAALRSNLCPRRPRQRQASPARVKPISFINRESASSQRPIEIASV